MPSIPIDESQPCQCTDGPMREAYPQHSIHEHSVFNEGSANGWQLARDTVLEGLPDQTARLTELLG